MIGVPFGIVDVSLAPTTKEGDSVARILEGMGVEKGGCARHQLSPSPFSWTRSRREAPWPAPTWAD